MNKVILAVVIAGTLAGGSTASFASGTATAKPKVSKAATTTTTKMKKK